MASGSTLAATERIETDVLIIGGGAAGMIAAIGATRAGVKPLVVTKGTYASGSSSMARGGYSIAIGHVDPEDSPHLFHEDAITAGYGLANPLLSQLRCEESIPRTLELDAWGLGLAKQPDGRFDQRSSSRPHRYRRLVHTPAGSAVRRGMCLIAPWLAAFCVTMMFSPDRGGRSWFV